MKDLYLQRGSSFIVVNWKLLVLGDEWITICRSDWIAYMYPFNDDDLIIIPLLLMSILYASVGNRLSFWKDMFPWEAV